MKFTKTLTWNPDGTPATVAEGTDTLAYVYDAAARLKEFKRGSTVLTCSASRFLDTFGPKKVGLARWGEHERWPRGRHARNAP